MSTLEDIFGTNTAIEEEGVWVTLTPTQKFKIRSFSAKKAVDLRDKLMRPYQAMVRAGGKMDDEIAEDVNLKVLSGGILADWDRTEDEVVIPFSKEAAYAEMKKFPRFATWVAQQALETQNFKDELDGDTEKNS